LRCRHAIAATPQPNLLAELDVSRRAVGGGDWAVKERGTDRTLRRIAAVASAAFAAALRATDVVSEETLEEGIEDEEEETDEDKEEEEEDEDVKEEDGYWDREGDRDAVLCAPVKPASMTGEIVDGGNQVDGLDASWRRATRTVFANSYDVSAWEMKSMMTTGGGSGGSGGSGGVPREVRVAGAVYATLSRFNHSCAPNCTWSFAAPTSHTHDQKHTGVSASGRGAMEASGAAAGLDTAWDDHQSAAAVEVRTIRSIVAGQELTVSYLDASDARTPRRSHLWAKYRFECDCDRCATEGVPPGGTRPAAGDCLPAAHPSPPHDWFLSAAGTCQLCGGWLGQTDAEGVEAGSNKGDVPCAKHGAGVWRCLRACGRHDGMEAALAVAHAAGAGGTSSSSRDACSTAVASGAGGTGMHENGGSSGGRALKHAEAAQGGDAGDAARAVQRVTSAVHVAQAALFDGGGTAVIAAAAVTLQVQLGRCAGGSSGGGSKAPPAPATTTVHPFHSTCLESYELLSVALSVCAKDGMNERIESRAAKLDTAKLDTELTAEAAAAAAAGPASTSSLLSLELLTSAAGFALLRAAAAEEMASGEPAAADSAARVWMEVSERMLWCAQAAGAVEVAGAVGGVEVVAAAGGWARRTTATKPAVTAAAEGCRKEARRISLDEHHPPPTGKDIALGWRAAISSNPLLAALAAHLPSWIFGDGMELDGVSEEGGDPRILAPDNRGARCYSRASEAALFRAVQLRPELAAHLAAAAGDTAQAIQR
jgi:hypothetical protein